VIIHNEFEGYACPSGKKVVSVVHRKQFLKGNTAEVPRGTGVS
jgi:hypothetical protein